MVGEVSTEAIPSLSQRGRAMNQSTAAPVMTTARTTAQINTVNMDGH